MLEMLLASKAGELPYTGPSYAIFVAGYSGTTAHNDILKYRYSNSVVTTSATILPLARWGGAGTGTLTFGQVHSGTNGFAAQSPQPAVDRFTFATDILTSRTNLIVGRAYVGAIGILTHAIIGGGMADNTSANLATTEKSVYASDVVSSATNLGVARQGLSGANNATVGIFAGGGNSATDRYTFANDVRAAGTATAIAMGYSASAGNNLVNITASNNGNSRYRYSDSTRAAGTALPRLRNEMGATGNPTIGIFAGGQATTNVVDTYTYANDTVANGTNLPSIRSDMSGFSTTPGGF